ncbi:MAG TPA: ATP-binding cassette domain-containing protein [Solirubrobacteraceae bacterium]|nr:ATP-binding cassette domain-containing protein [Solirubrobacteraceae bacterium]
MDAVRATGLDKRYGTTTAVDGVDLAVAPGQVRGLLGPNGAGKTTLLRMLFGLIHPDAGSVELLGRPLDGLGGGALEEVGGFVEEPAFYPYLSGRANLTLLARLDAGPSATAVERALARVGLERRGEDRVAGYSTGMRQRLGLAAALLRSPRLLLLDEPTSGLDPGGTRTVAALVRELATEGVAVLLCSHQIGALERVCDAYTVLREGRVVWDGSAAELVAQAPASAYALATSDDEQALRIAAEQVGVRAGRSTRGELALAVHEGCLDAFVFALGDARVAIRRLDLLVSPLEAMFFALTSDGAPLAELEPVELAETVLAGAER